MLIMKVQNNYMPKIEDDIVAIERYDEFKKCK